MKTFVAPDFTRALERQAIKHELFTGNQLADNGAISSLWLPWIYRACLVIDYTQRLLNLQGPRVAVGAQAVPVEKAESSVAGLLDFSQQQSRAQAVDRSRRQINTIANLGM